MSLYTIAFQPSYKMRRVIVVDGKWPLFFIGSSLFGNIEFYSIPGMVIRLRYFLFGSIA